MASGRFSAALVLFVSLAMLAVQQTAEARSIIRGMPTASAAAAAVVGSSAGSASTFSHRRMLAAPVAVARMAKASEAALPADAYVVASPCPAATAAPGSSATAVFTVGASLNAEQFKEVSLQVDFPKALWPTVSLTCMTSNSQAISCDAPEVNPEDIANYDVVSTACMLGDLAVTGPVTCTFSYKVPTTPLPSSVDARQILGSITFAPLAANVVEDSINNAAATCAMSA